MTTNTPMKAALQRWCRENDIVPGVLVRAAWKGCWVEAVEQCAETLEARARAQRRLSHVLNDKGDYEDASELKCAADTLGQEAANIRALTTDQGEKEQADGVES